MSSRQAFHEAYNLEILTEDSLFAPGFIQPYGGLMVLERPDLTIRQVSQNIEEFLRVPIDNLLGYPLQRATPPSMYQCITDHLEKTDLGWGTIFELEVTPSPGTPPTTLCCQLHPIATGTDQNTPNHIVLLELEPKIQTEGLDPLEQLHQGLLDLRKEKNLADLSHRLAKTVKAWTGFDRVMVYQFMEDAHGVVIAEEKEADRDSFLGLHYPAFDIPEPSRRLFLRNWVRVIPNVQGIPIGFVPTLGDQPLDLSSTTVRGVSPYHIEYLQNMGVAATMTISLIVDQRLWGLIACHHYTPRLVPLPIRKTCELLGQLASTELMQIQVHQSNVDHTRIRAIQNQLHQAVRAQPSNANVIGSVLTEHQTELCELFKATGMALALDGHLILMGKTPSVEETQNLVTWLTENHPEDLFATHTLPEHYPPAKAFHEVASGVLIVSIYLSNIVDKTYHLLWFRPEQVQFVNWGGKPEDALKTDELGHMALCPRRSFALWQETVMEQSTPWTPTELEIAYEVRNVLMLALLEVFSQIALEAERAEVQRAEQANQAKRKFIAHMSHELRTPLNVILGFTQLLSQDPSVSAQVRDNLNTISRSGEHLLALINDILEISKIEAGRLELVAHTFDLHRLIYNVEDMFASRASSKGIQFQVEVSPNVPQYVYGDESKLRQILINLLSNAIKFTSEGGVMLWVSCPVLNADSSDIPLTIVVSDTGVGIPRREQEAIFDAFHQTATGQSALEGTGLGLAISRQFARLMEGNITVSSTPDTGSTFTCKLRLHSSQAEVNDLQIPDAPNSCSKISSLAANQSVCRILVVDDLLESRQLLCRVLEPIGFEVMTAANGEEAIQCWQTWQPHLILMDMQMPQMDGYLATQRIRDWAIQQAKSEQIPQPIIVALTANAFGEDRDRCLQAGCDDHMPKPFDVEELLIRISHWLGVCYDYVERPELLPSVTPDPLTCEELTGFSLDWRQAFREAAFALDDKTLLELLAQLPEDACSVASRLTDLVDNFEFEKITQLFEDL